MLIFVLLICFVRVIQNGGKYYCERNIRNGGWKGQPMDSLYIIIPAYNEESNIESVVEGWYPIVEKHFGDGQSRLVIIDDGSKDDTFAILQKLAQTRPLLLPVTKENGGHGATVLYGYQYALKQNADYVFQTDSDGQTLPEEFEQFWELREQYSMVIGNRQKRGDGLSRVLVTKTLKMVIGLCFHVSVQDANTPYRLMQADTLRENIQYVPENYFLSNALLATIYTKRKNSIKYLPITFRERQGGINSINIPKIIKIGREALHSFLVLNKQLENCEK